MTPTNQCGDQDQCEFMRLYLTAYNAGRQEPGEGSGLREIMKRILERALEDVADKAGTEDADEKSYLTGRIRGLRLAASMVKDALTASTPPEPTAPRIGAPLVAEGLPAVTEGPGLGWKLSKGARDEIEVLIRANVQNASDLYSIVLATLPVPQTSSEGASLRAIKAGSGASPSLPVRREEIARVIDPRAWETLDVERANPTVTAKNKEPWSWERYYEGACKPSLAKAQAILELFRPSPSTREE